MYVTAPVPRVNEGCPETVGLEVSAEEKRRVKATGVLVVLLSADVVRSASLDGLSTSFSAREARLLRTGAVPSVR